VYSSDLEGAQMFARKFEKLHPEDVASLEEDLALLREIEKEKDLDAGK
jgi:DNA-directed RNA polymerase subunit F